MDPISKFSQEEVWFSDPRENVIHNSQGHINLKVFKESSSVGCFERKEENFFSEMAIVFDRKESVVSIVSIQMCCIFKW